MTRSNRVVLASVFAAATIARANAIYTYTGRPFDGDRGTAFYLANRPVPLGGSIDLTFDFRKRLPPGLANQTVTPASWALSTGSGFAFTPDDPDLSLSQSTVSTDASGQIGGWDFEVVDDSIHTYTASSGTGDDAHTFGPDFAGDTFTSRIGTWTSPPAVLEPAPFSLLILGLGGTFLLAKRQLLHR